MLCVVSRRGGKFVKLSRQTHNSVLMSVIMSSMKIIRNVMVVLALLSIALATSACPEKGPAEKAGEKIDDAIEKTKEAVKEPTK